MTHVHTVTATLVSLAALLTLVRLARGPSALDRIVALDVLVALIVVAVALRGAEAGEGRTVPLLLVLALLGFIGSITAAHMVEERSDVR
jgi:multicomponent Na+:H+ antiporter subunit F